MDIPHTRLWFFFHLIEYLGHISTAADKAHNLPSFLSFERMNHRVFSSLPLNDLQFVTSFCYYNVFYHHPISPTMFFLMRICVCYSLQLWIFVSLPHFQLSEYYYFFFLKRRYFQGNGLIHSFLKYLYFHL